MRLSAVLASILLLAGACLSPPKPTAESLRIAANPPAVVEGVVRDRNGAPVPGIQVRGLPRGKDIPWSPPATTDAEGRFRLSLAAPGPYGFLLSWRGVSVVTPLPEDPARLWIPVEPAGRVTGVELLFLEEEWEREVRSEAIRPES